jgi:hypothetical protein
MTKAQQILALYDGKRSTREIAEIVGCDPAYVRVAARQRHGGSRSEIDKRYVASPLGKETKRKVDAAYYRANREYVLSYMRSYYQRKKAKREAAHA